MRRVGMLGASGGGPHALACAALMPNLVFAVATVACIAPFDGMAFGGTAFDGTAFDKAHDWFDGMADGGAALKAAARGREARELFQQTAEFDPASFNDRDYAALQGRWSALGDDVQRSVAEGGARGLIDDDLAFTAPWGFGLEEIEVPVLLVQGGDDRVVPPAHARAMLGKLVDGELWQRPRDGHASIMDAAALALDWLAQHAR